MEKKYYLLTFNEDWADEHNVPALTCFNREQFEEWKKSKQSLSAYLGNSGDNFMEEEQGLTGEQLLKKGLVSKTIVTEEFYKLFNKADLSSLSLCSVFKNDYEEEEE